MENVAFNGKQIDLDAIISSLPDGIQVEVSKYAPALLEMTYAEIWDWIHLIMDGHSQEAYQTMVQRMPKESIADEWSGVNNSWSAANTKNANRINVIQTAAEAILSAVMQLAISLVLL